jgi:DNA-binding beta-propeller fold protein YncE
MAGQDRGQSPQYPQQRYGQQYPQDAPWQPPQYDQRPYQDQPEYGQQPGWGQPPQQAYPPQRPLAAPGRRRRKSWPARHKVLTGFLVFAVLAVTGGIAVAVGGPGSSSGTSAAALPPTPPATVLVLGSKLTLINAATHAIGKQLPFGDDNMGGETGSTQMAFARTARGLIAYVLSGADVMPVNVATDTAGKPIKIAGSVIAASPDGRTVYVVTDTKTGPDSYSGVVVPINTATDAVGRPIPVGAQPDAIAFAPDGKTAYVANADTVTPIDVAAGTAGPYIPVGTGPDAVIFAPDGKTAYVDGSEVVPIDVATGTAEAAIPVKANALAISPDGKKLYALNGSSGGPGMAAADTVTPIDTATNSPGTPISLSSAPQNYLELLMAPNGKTLYAIDQQGQLTPIDTQTNAAEPTVEDGEGYATDMAITPDGKTIYIVDPEDNTVIPYDAVTQTIGKPINLAGSNPNVEVAYYVAVAP